MRKLLRVSFVVALWVPIIVIATGLARGGASDFAGFEIGAKATAAQWTFDSPSLGVPAKPTGEINIAFSEAILKSGPSAYGIGSIAWPGQVAAALPTFVQGEIGRQSGEEFPTDLPNYPIRAESFHPQGPPSASSNVGTMGMRSQAREGIADGSAHANALGFPGIGGAGAQTSMATSGFDQQGAVAMVEAATNDISLLAGLVKIDAVVTRATARSDGVKGTVAGTTTVAGAEVQGTKVAIDATGVHAGDGEGIDSAAQQAAVNQVLTGVGISMELSAPVDTIRGGQATRALGGLLVRIKASTASALVDALPEPLQGQIRGQITFDQDMTVQFAPAVVTAGAGQNVEFGDVVPPAADTSGGTSTSGGGSVAPVADTGGGTTGAAPAPPGVVALAPTSSDFTGVPVWLVIVLVLAAFVSSRPLMALADRALAVRAAGGCPDQES